MSVNAVRETKKNRSNSTSQSKSADRSAVESNNAAQFFGMVEHAPLTKFFIQPDGTVSYLNGKGHEVLRSLSETLGFGPEELVGGSVDRVYTILPELEQAARNLTEQKTVRVQLGDETLDVYLIPLSDEDGNPIGLFHGWDVITERIQSEAIVKDAADNARAVNQILQALADAKTVSEAAQIALDNGRDAYGMDYGSFWVLDQSDNTLKFAVESGSVNEEFRRVTESASFAEGVGLSGRAWRDRDLVFVKDLGEMADCCRAPVALRAGVKSGVCFPIIKNGRVVGTMDFFSVQTLEPSEARLESIRNVGRLVSGTLESLEQQEEAVRVQSMVENAPINVIFADTDHRITYVNPASVATLKTLEDLLPVSVDQIVGQNIDIFHKNPEYQRKILDNPSKLPHRGKIKLGEETLDLLISAIRDSNGERIGSMATWSVITNQVRMADDFETNVKGVVEIVTSSATELQASAKSMAATAEETSRQSQVVAAASEEATKNVETVSSAAEELSASISEISRHVQEASRMTQQAVQQADQTNVTIKDLGESSNEIGQVIKVITSIAQQTNLLALNATIEAARAGEAGKGFAVVANEVKELARQTAKATEEISEKIGAIQGATGGAAAAIASIGESIGKINEISTTIASAVEEQTAATNEISRNVTEAARGTAEVSSNIAGVSQAADEAGRGAGDIQTAADGLSQESANLDKVTNDFLEQLRAL